VWERRGGFVRGSGGKRVQKVVGGKVTEPAAKHWLICGRWP
jgi:hypothetical protein